MFCDRSFLRATCLAVLTLSSAFGIVRRDDVAQNNYKNLALQSQFSSVGRIDFNYGDGQGYLGAGSGTLIGSNRILSAGHMFDSTTLQGVVGIHFVLGSFTYTIDLNVAGSFTVHPGYNSTTLENDLSIAFLTTSSTVAPAALFNNINLQGISTTMVGYGMTGTGLSGSVTYDGIKRAGTNVIDVVSSQNFEIDFDNPSGTVQVSGSTQPTALEAMVGPGDSGGSVWLQSGTTWAVVGVTSYGIDENGNDKEDDYGDIGGFVRVSEYLPWIESFGPVTVVPEPSTFWLLGLGLGLSGVFLRRKARRPTLGGSPPHKPTNPWRATDQ